MSAVVRAEQAVERARTAVVRELTNPTEWVTGEAGATDKDAMRLVDALVRAVEARCVAAVHAEPLPDFPPGEDPGVVARTVRSMDLRAIQTGGTSDLLM